jgi:D-proline reductase (dithiol) PrdB
MLRGDALVRMEQSSRRERLSFEPSWVTAPDLANSKVAIVTTAGLRDGSHELFAAQIAGFSVIPDAARKLTMVHSSQNFDRSGFLADINVVFPIDRIHELADRGEIGAVASNHLSFMGAMATPTLEALRLDSGPAAAKLLRDDGVDVVVLTPV